MRGQYDYAIFGFTRAHAAWRPRHCVIEYGLEHIQDALLVIMTGDALVQAGPRPLPQRCLTTASFNM